MQTRSLLVGALVGAALVAAVWIGWGLARSDDPGPPTPETSARPDRPPSPRDRWNALAERLESVAARLDAGVGREAAPGAPTLRGHADAMTPERASDEAPALDAEALADALERVEVRREAKLSNNELLALARRRLYTDKDPVRGRRTLELLLSRDLEPEERVEAQTQLGIAQRSLGDYEASIQVLTEALASSSVDEGPGVEAAFQLMWTHKYNGDNAAATRVGEQIVRGQHGHKTTLVVTYRTLGLMAQEDGDLVRARREYETSLRVAGQDPLLAQQRLYTQRLLDALE